MKCPLKYGLYDFEGGEDCIGDDCGMHKLCGANDGIAVENDVSVASVDSNAGNADTREKLEADATNFCERFYTTELRYNELIELLDRQAAITRRETVKRQEVFCDTCESVTDEYANELQKRCDELQAKVDELTEDYKASSSGLEILTLKNAELQTQVNNLNSENAKLSSDELHLRQALAQSEHELATLRDKLGRMLDNAHEITRIGGDC